MTRFWRQRFDVLEIVLVALICVGGWWALSVTAAQTVPSDEAKTLKRTYGPARSSQHGEEWIIRDFFGDRRGGFFLDVGANHYQRFSNTYFLETALGWEGIAVEPLVAFAADYGLHRPRTRFRPFFVSDVSNEQARLYVQEQNSLVSSGDRRFNEAYGSAPVARDVLTITLTDLLQAEGVERVDFLNMDIELWEPKALAGFDIRRYRPELVCIEAHPEVRQAILDYFTANGYVVVGRYLRADIWNLYFTPLGTPGPSQAARQGERR
ncbi:MAG TPA: FkbM family methyltransferase [Vicinamibacterales bacterium]|nr:FkbM family methyltransferase [Vicinamibacterales bacterium]